MDVLIDPSILIEFGAVFRRYEKSQVVYYEGSLPQYYFQIISGSLSMTNVNEDGTEFIQGIYGEGECFGSAALFIDEMYPANALAMTDIVLIRLGREAFFNMVQAHPDVLLKITRSLCSKLYHKFLINRSMAMPRPEERITTLLQLLKKESGCAIDKQFRLAFSRQQIADMIGLRVETVIRAMKRLEEKGNVIITHGKVYY